MIASTMIRLIFYLVGERSFSNGRRNTSKQLHKSKCTHFQLLSVHEAGMWRILYSMSSSSCSQTCILISGPTDPPCDSSWYVALPCAGDTQVHFSILLRFLLEQNLCLVCLSYNLKLFCNLFIQHCEINIFMHRAL